MRKLLVLLCVVCLSGRIAAEMVTITSLPYTFDADDRSGDDIDTLVLQGTKLSASGDGITLASVSGNALSGVLLLLGTDTISYGEGGGNGAIGIDVARIGSDYPNNIEIRGGYILHNTPDSTADDCRAINIRGRDILIKDVTANVRGYNGITLEASGTSVHTLEIDGGTYNNFVTGFTSRCNYDACVIKVDNLYLTTLQEAGADYHAYIHGVTILDGPHMGIAILGRGEDPHYAVGRIENCTVQTDARNSFYTSYSGLCLSCANPYALTFRRVGPGSTMLDNVITSGTSYGGNRGIMVEYGWGTEETPILIRGNSVDVHEGPNVEYSSGLPVHGLRIRYQPHWITADFNTFIATGDDASLTDSYVDFVQTVRLSTNTASTHVTLRNNTIRAVDSGSTGSDYIAVSFDGIDYDSTFFLESNNVTSPGTIYKFGHSGTQDNGPTGVTIIGDTVSFTNSTADQYTFHLGYLTNPWNCTGNIARDLVYQDSTAFDDITYASGGEADIRIEQTATVNVKGSNGLPVEDANVWIVDGYYDTANVVTDSLGVASAVRALLWDSRTLADSTGFVPLSIGAAKDGDTTTTTLALSPTVNSVSLILSATQGVAPAPDQTRYLRGVRK